MALCLRAHYPNGSSSMATEEEALFDNFLQGASSEARGLREATSEITPLNPELAAPVGISETFSRGVRAGAAGMDSDAQYFLALGNTLMGDEEGAEERVKRARLAETAASNTLANTQSFEDFVEAPTFSGFLDQALLAGGQVAVPALSAIGTSIGGALVGASAKLGANALTRATTKKLVDDIADKARKSGYASLTPDEKAIIDYGYGLARNAKRGAVAGALAQEYPMMAGGSFAEFDEAGVELDAERAFQSAVIGAPLAAVGVAGEAFVVKSLANLATKKARKQGTSALREYAQNIAGAALQGGATEAGTEVIQEGAMVAQRMAVDPEYDAQQAQLRLGQAAFAGFFGGKAISGSGAAVAGIPAAVRATQERAKQFIDDRYEANVTNQVNDEIELSNIEEQFELDLPDSQEDAPAADTPPAPTDTGARDMQLAGELAAFMDANPEQDPRNIDADDTGDLPFDPEGPFSDINPEEDRGREPRAVKSYQIQQDRFRQQSLDDPEYNQRFNLLNQLYERRGYTEDDGTSVLEKFRGALSPSNLKVLAELIVKNSENATYFPEYQTVNGERRVVIMEYPTEQGRRRSRTKTIDAETGQEVEANAAELANAAISRAESGAGKPDIPKFRVVDQIFEERQVDGESQRVLKGFSPFGDLEGEANNQNVELGFIANEGISINMADQASLFGDGLSRAQQLKLGLFRVLGELATREKALSFEGEAIDVDALTNEATSNTDENGRYNGDNRILNTPIVSEGFNGTLGDVLVTPDPRFQKDATRQRQQDQRVEGALSRADFDEDIGAIRQKYRREFVRNRNRMRAEGRSEREIKLMGANLKSRMATEIAAFTEFDPTESDIESDLDPLNNPNDRAEQEFRQEGGLDQEDADNRVPARPEDPQKKEKTERINARFDARANRIRARSGSSQNAAVEDAIQQQLTLNELRRKEELEKLNYRPAETMRARPSRILLEMQPMTGDLMPGSSLRAADARTMGKASLNPQGRQLGPTGQAVNRQARRVKRKTAPSVTLNGKMGNLSSRIVGKAMSFFKFSKPVHVFTLSDLKENWEFYVGGNRTLATGIVATGNYVSGPIFERTNAIMESDGLSREAAQDIAIDQINQLPEAERTAAFNNSELGAKSVTSRAKQTPGKGLYAPVAEFLSETISRMDQVQDGVRVPGRMLPTGDAYIIVVNDTDVQSGSLGDAAMGAVLAHEMGHLLFKEEMQSLLDKPRGKLLFEAFKRDVDALGDDLPGQYADGNDIMSLGFEEWYADQVAFFLYNESAKPDTGAKAYFKQIAKKLKDFMKEVSRILGGRIAQAQFTNKQANVPFRKQRENESDAKYAEAKAKYEATPFAQTYFEAVVQEHKRKTRELVDEYDEVGWSQQYAFREMAIDVKQKIADGAPDLLNNYKNVVEQMMKSGTYKFLSRFLSSVDGWMREQGDGGVGLARMFMAKSQSEESRGFHQAKGLKNREFNNRLAEIFGLSIKSEENDWETPEVKGALELAQDETVTDATLNNRAENGDTIAAKALEVRGLFSSIFDEYIVNPKTGRPWFRIAKRMNYAPRMWDFVAVQENPDAFRALLIDSGIPRDRVEGILKAIDENESSEDIRFGETEEEAELRRDIDELNREAEALSEKRGITVERAREIIRQAQERARLSPGMDASLARELELVSTADAREAGFMQPAGVAMIQYFHQLTRKVEYERRGGYAQVKAYLEMVDPDMREHMEDAILAQLGKKGQGMSGGWRLFNSIAAVHTALTTLLFTVFASVTDLAGIATRLKEFGNLKDFGKEVMYGFTESFTGEGERVQFAQDVNVVTMEAMDNMFIAVGELDFANKWARKTMAAFFKYTGLNWYTRATRIIAANMGKKFVIRTATKQDFGDREARYLRELGLTREEVLAAYDAETDSLNIRDNENLRAAIGTFAEEAIIRPDPAQRPSWASNPYYTIVWQLKSYFYAYGKTVLGGIGREVSNRYREDGSFEGGGALLLMAAGFMLPLTALGLELREYFKWGFQALLPGIEATDRTFRSDHMSAGEYMFEIGIDRSGVLGPFTLGLTAIESLKWEGPMGPIISNIPFVDAFDDVFLDGDYMRTVPVLNNVQ